MIIKKTKATFIDGPYKGEHDWQGGVPLSKGEVVTLKTSQDEGVEYLVSAKDVLIEESGDDQIVSVTFELKVVD